MSHWDRVAAKPQPPTPKQVAYLRTLLQTIGVVDPDHDEQWPATATRILARPVTTGNLDQFTRNEVSSLIDACKRFVAEESAKTERIPVEFVNVADDPWAASPPQRIRYRGHDYELVTP